MAYKFRIAFSVFLIVSFMLILTSSSLAQNESSYGPPIIGEGYTISRSYIDHKVLAETFFDDIIVINNSRSQDMTISISVEGNVADLISFDSDGSSSI